jgi:gamma-tubulin complex component 5
VAKEIWHLDRWAANQEELMAKACAGITPDGSSGSVVSLLAIEHALRNQFGEVLVALHDIVNQIQSQEDATPATTATLILDQLTKGVEQQRIMGSESATQALFRVFVHTAEPMWSMVGQWLKNGMKADDREDELDEEFFIQKASSSTSGGLLDPDFWIKGYVLRDEDHSCSTSPGFLLEQTQIILESGKTTGLLRLLDAPGLERIQVPWPIFRDLMFSQKEGQPTGSVTVNRLSYLISNEIGQYFTFLNGTLIDFLVNECDMRQHIHAIEDLYFLGRGDAMTDFTDVLFSKV